MKVLSFSETGCVRKNNEDAYLALPEYGLYAVADGMGGALAGEVASQTALGQLEKLAPKLVNMQDGGLETGLAKALAQANRVVYEISTERPETEGMGTTLTALLVRKNQGFIAHVGDSRAYLWRGNELVPLTVDHSLVGELVRLGQISPEEAEKHPQRHMIIRAVGTSEQVEVDSRPLDLLDSDVILLCTDGFSNLLSDDEIQQEFQRNTPWQERLENLRQMVLQRGAPDNFTVLCCILESTQ